MQNAITEGNGAFELETDICMSPTLVEKRPILIVMPDSLALNAQFRCACIVDVAVAV